MEDIKVGEYIRTTYGQIRQIVDFEDGLYVVNRSIPIKQENVVLWAKCVKRKEITKHSENLIDLIEVGDVIEYKYRNTGTGIVKVNKNFKGFSKCVEIKTILTHEQYEQNCCKESE